MNETSFSVGHWTGQILFPESRNKLRMCGSVVSFRAGHLLPEWQTTTSVGKDHQLSQRNAHSQLFLLEFRGTAWWCPLAQPGCSSSALGKQLDEAFADLHQLMRLFEGPDPRQEALHLAGSGVSCWTPTSTSLQTLKCTLRTYSTFTACST